jgi:hypothetical protein
MIGCAPYEIDFSPAAQHEEVYILWLIHVMFAAKVRSMDRISDTSTQGRGRFALRRPSADGFLIFRPSASRSAKRLPEDSASAPSA